MQFWLCRQPKRLYDGEYYFTNFCPYRNDAPESLSFWYPYWLGGYPFDITASQLNNNANTGLEALGGEIPCGSCKNIITGKIILIKDLLPMEEWRNNHYYEWGIE